jgi:integrase/recombinase XerD
LSVLDWKKCYHFEVFLCDICKFCGFFADELIKYVDFDDFMVVDVMYNMKREMLRRKLSPRSVKAYLFWVNKFLLANKDKSPREFSKKDVREFLYDMEERDVSGSTLNVAHNALRFMMIEVLHKACYLKIRYAKTPVRKVSYLTKEEIKKLLQAITNPKHKLLVSLMYGAGLRVSEATHLKPKDFSFKENIGWVRNGKGQKDRPFIIPQSIKEELIDLCLKEPVWLFAGRRGCLSVKSVQLIVMNAGIKAKLDKHIHPHMLRHSFTTHLLEQGIDVTSVQSLLGHVRPETTLGYSHMLSPKFYSIKSPLD